MLNRYCLFPLLTITFISVITYPASAQNAPPKYIQKAIQKLEKLFTSNADSAILSFTRESIQPSNDVDQQGLASRLKELKNEVGNRWKNVAVRPDPKGVRLIFSEMEPVIHLKVVLDENGIYNLYSVDPPEPISFTQTNIAEVFKKLEDKGMSGVAYIQIDGKILFKKGFGAANKSLESPNTTETIFGIGSRPIDFTRAAIYLLEQRGHIKQSDSIDQYFENVPADKQPMTIHHLMTGQSGLPDFFHTSEDRDPDLAWIDRNTAINRLLSQKLLFPPGSDRQHSHGAFVMLAGLIEKVTGESYFDFLNQNFFEPADMQNTNEYGIADDHNLSDFAVGYGTQSTGLPNIPPNWGPTSWLIKGSGGMYSTLGDLLNFYDFLRSRDVLNANYQNIFEQPSVNLDGSERGFELFSAYQPNGNQAYVFLNDPSDYMQMRALFRAVEEFVMQEND